MSSKSRRRQPAKNQKRSGVWIWVGVGIVAVSLVAFFMPVGGTTRPAATQDAPVRYQYRVFKAYPHDPKAFTQGLLFLDGYLYESTGLHGRSTLRKVRLETGEVLQEQSVDAKHFAEGLADMGTSLVQLTWQSNLGFVYDIKTFGLLRTFIYSGEGWGLTRDGNRLVMSDGTPYLRFLDPETLAETGRVQVTDGGRPVEDLNELESVKGQILANVWQTDEIVIIAPQTGHVVGRVNLRELLPPAQRSGVDVLNGIAYDAQGDRLFVTGKLWPLLFEIRLQRP